MVIDTPEAALVEVRRLGLPDVFVRVWEGSLSSPLSREWETPRLYFRDCKALAARVPRLDGLCPLFEVNGEAIVGVISGREFVRFYYEDAARRGNSNDAVEALGHNYQQFVTQVLLEWEEAGLTDEFEEVAQLLEYKHTRALRAILDAYDPETGEQKLESFKASVS